MRRGTTRSVLTTSGILTASWVVASIVLLARPQSAAGMKQIGTIPLPGVAGRIDHLAFDAVRQRLFVAALGNDTVEVLDTATGAHLQSLTGFHEPQGVATVPEFGAVAVANGGTGTLQLLDAQTFQTRWTARVGGDADNVRNDAAAKRLYVAAQGGLFAVDSASGRVLQHIAIAGHPESFQLEARGTRIFANLPGETEIVVSDRKAMAVSVQWGTGSCQSNYPLAVDEATAQILVGCRRPSRVAVFDATSGKMLSTSDAVGDADDLFYDAVRRQVYVIGGEGFVDVFVRDGGGLLRTARVPTRSGARTGLWVAAASRLYVAVPARGREAAEVRVFQAP